jgi:hypothetical protein
LVKKLGVRLDQTFLEQDVIADLNDSTFFYRATWRKNILDWAVDAIGLGGLSGPAVSLITYLFQTAIDDLLQRRAFYQNYTLHYLLSFSPHDLGLKKSEVNSILSSLYEARIEFYDILESQKAQSDWAHFGTNSMKQDSDDSARRLADNASNYQSIGSPYDFIFYPVRTRNGSLIENFRDPLGFGSTLPSLAFDNQNPTGIRDLRIAEQVFLLAINVAPITSLVQSVVTWLVRSQFAPQIESEGALMAEFELTGDSSRMNAVVDQSVNPWLLTDGI